jgi:ribosomal protein L31E
MTFSSQSTLLDPILNNKIYKNLIKKIARKMSQVNSR